MPSFSVLKSWHMYAYPHPNGVQNGSIASLKIDHIFPWSTFLEASFPTWRSVLCELLGIYRKCFFLQFLTRFIRIHGPILTRVELESISSWKMVIFGQKLLFLMLNFQGEDHVYAMCFFNIFTSCNKWIPFQLLYVGIRIHIPFPTGFKTNASVNEKVVIFGRKKPVLKLN